MLSALGLTAHRGDFIEETDSLIGYTNNAWTPASAVMVPPRTPFAEHTAEC